MVTAKNKDGKIVPITDDQIVEITISLSQTYQLKQFCPRNKHISIKLNYLLGQDINELIQYGTEIVNRHLKQFTDLVLGKELSAVSTQDRKCQVEGCEILISDIELLKKTKSEYGKVLCEEHYQEEKEKVRARIKETMKMNDEQFSQHLKTIKKESSGKNPLFK